MKKNNKQPTKIQKKSKKEKERYRNAIFSIDTKAVQHKIKLPVGWIHPVGGNYSNALSRISRLKLLYHNISYS